MSRSASDTMAPLTIEAKYRLLTEHAEDWVFLLDADGRHLYDSPACLSMTGYVPADFAADPELFVRCIVPEDRALYEVHVRQRHGADDGTLEFRVRHSDGSLRWLAHSCRALFDEQGCFLGRCGRHHDITARKATELTLRRLNRTLQALRHSTRAMLHAENEQWLLREVCRIVVEDCGYAFAWVGLIEDGADKCVRPVAQAGCCDGLLGALDSSWTDMERGQGPTARAIRERKPVVCRDGQHDPDAPSWCDNTLHPDFASFVALPLLTGNVAGGALNIFSRDVDAFSVEEVALLGELAQELSFGLNALWLRGELELTTGELARSNVLLQRTFDAIPDLVTVHDRDLNVLFSNWKGHDYIPQHQRISPVQKCYQLYMRRETPCEPCHACEVFATGRAKQLEVLNPVDNHLREINVYPVCNDKGEVVMVMEHVRDISDRLQWQEEQERLRNQLVQAQKMESIGRLAGGVAHDFNNKLGVILGNVELALMRHSTDFGLLRQLEEIREAAEQSASLTRQLLAFARQQTISPRLIHLNETAAGILRMLQRLIGENIRLTWHPGEGLHPLLLDPVQVDQILANLAVNARDAIDGVGELVIETTNVLIDDEYRLQHPEVPPGDYVMLAVSDNGCGMSPEVQQKIFEPFFTTKEVGEGTGLGLATVYGIVKQNRGFIYVSSEPGRGTTFRIFFPRCPDEHKSRDDKRSEPIIVRGTETVLLVEDDPGVRLLAKEMLEQLGYTVFAAAGPGDALRIAREYRGSLELLLSDVVMPELNGRELADRLREIRPGIRCLFMSGYTANVVVHQGILHDDVHLLQKPFGIAALASGVRQALQG